MKAMVVLASGFHAVRYKIEFDRYIDKMGFDDIKTIVTLLGIVNDCELP